MHYCETVVKIETDDMKSAEAARNPALPVPGMLDQATLGQVIAQLPAKGPAFRVFVRELEKVC